MTKCSMYGLLLDLSACCQEALQVNPQTVFNDNSKQSAKSGVRLWRSYKARFREKLLNLSIYAPYRKPTQVISSSRVRRTSERSPRNSAKKQP